MSYKSDAVLRPWPGGDPPDEYFEQVAEEEKLQLDKMRAATTYWKDAFRRFKKNKVAVIAACVLFFIVLCAIVVPIVSPYSYDQQIRTETRQAPSLRHPLGTDMHGRDVLVRLMIGTRISLLVGFISTVMVLIIGATYGGFATFFGGWTETIMMRIVDLIMAVPSLLVIILISVAMRAPLNHLIEQGGFWGQFSRIGAGLLSIFIVFALFYWTGMARTVRGALVSVRSQEYVLAAQSMGAKPGRIIFRHMAPNGMGTIVVAATSQVPDAIFTESFLSFIGLGVSAPMASLGSMASDALNGFISYPYLLLFPAVVLALIILSLNLVGDGLRDALDPRLRSK